MDYLIINKTIARVYGINIALILNDFAYWDNINKSNRSEHHLRDGRYWVYYSHKSLAEHLEVISERQVQTAIEKMIAEGLIIVSDVNYNKTRFDKTSWYSLTEKALKFFANSKQQNVESRGHKMYPPKQHNVEPIPNNNPNDNHNNNHFSEPAKKPQADLPLQINTKPKVEVDMADGMRELAYRAWLDLIGKYGYKFTRHELRAIKSYAYSKPRLPMHEVDSALELLEKWALEGLDIENSLRQSLSTRALIRPTMRIEYDARKNRIYDIDQLNTMRHNQIGKEEQEATADNANSFTGEQL